MLPLLSHVECYLLNEGLQNIVADSNVIAFSPHFVMFADARDFFTFLGKKNSQRGWSNTGTGGPEKLWILNS